MATLVTRSSTNYSPAGSDGQPTRTEIVDLIGEDGVTVIASFQNTSNSGNNPKMVVTGGPVAVYRALLNQSGTDAPVADVVYENTIGDDLVWARSTAGVYSAGRADGEALPGTVMPFTQAVFNANSGDIHAMVGGGDVNGISLNTFDNADLTAGADDVLANTPVHILFYA